MRGKGFVVSSSMVTSGITPAYAGKSPHMLHAAFPSRDHPRLCGEKSMIDIFAPERAGSPPPMRGKEGVFDWWLETGRITPAYAGKRTDNFL